MQQIIANLTDAVCDKDEALAHQRRDKALLAGRIHALEKELKKAGSKPTKGGFWGR